MRASVTKQISVVDRDFILDSLEYLLVENLRNEKILITGATGFFGKWLTQALLTANDRFQLKNEFVILTRDPAAAQTNLPWLADRLDVTFIKADIRNWNSESSEQVYSTIIHGAATASQSLNANSPNEMFETIVEGTKNILRCAQKSKRVLFISSGAVYGPQRAIEKLREFDPFQDGTYSAYADAKRIAESLCLTAAAKSDFDLKIARCFAFLGPYLPLDTHFAAGNFIAQALAGEPIKIGGDGTPLRSYLYPSDLTIWLLTILLLAKSNSIYNVGSDQALTILELAKKFSIKNANEHPLPVEIAKMPIPGSIPERYIPSIENAKNDFDLKVWTSLDEAIAKTLAWYRG